MAKIPLEFLRSVACVWVNGKVAGTGFIISPGVMLTCAHVVQRKSKQHFAPEQIRLEFLADLYGRLDSQNATLPGDTESKSFQFRVQNSQKSWPISKVCHFDPTLDVALLKFEAPVSENVVPARVSFRTSLRDLKVQTFGFALRDDPREDLGPNTGSKKGGRKKSVPSVSDSDAEETVTRLVHGRFATAKLQIPVPAPESSQHFQLASFGQIEPGFSGAPICDSASGQVIGMIRCCDAGGTAHHAFCIPLDEIRKSVPEIQRLYRETMLQGIRTRLEDGRDTLRQTIFRLLRRSPRSAQLFAEKIGCVDPQPSDDLPTEILTRLAVLGVRKSLGHLCSLFKEVTESAVPDRDTADLLVGLFMAYAPDQILKSLPDDLVLIRAGVQGIQDDQVRLNGDDILAEVYMAAMDGRAAEYQSYQPRKEEAGKKVAPRMRGRNHLDPQPESGIGDGSLPIDKIRDRIWPKEGLWNNPDLSEDRKRQFFNDHLRFQHEDVGQTLYLTFDEKNPVFNKQQLVEFCNVFRYIAVVHLNSTEISERDRELISPFAAGHLRSQNQP